MEGSGSAVSGREGRLSLLRSLRRVLCSKDLGTAAAQKIVTETSEIMKFLKVIASVSAVMGAALFSSCSQGPPMVDPPSYVAPAK